MPLSPEVARGLLTGARLVVLFSSVAPFSLFSDPSLHWLLQANRQFGNTAFDKKKFVKKLQTQQKGSYKPLDLATGEVNHSQHVLKNMCHKPWAFWFLWKSGWSDFPTQEVRVGGPILGLGGQRVRG